MGFQVRRVDHDALGLRSFAGKPGELELERTIERVRNCGLLRENWGTEISAEFAALG